MCLILPTYARFRSLRVPSPRCALLMVHSPNRVYMRPRGTFLTGALPTKVYSPYRVYLRLQGIAPTGVLPLKVYSPIRVCLRLNGTLTKYVHSLWCTLPTGCTYAIRVPYVRIDRLFPHVSTTVVDGLLCHHAVSLFAYGPSNCHEPPLRLWIILWPSICQ